MLLCIDVGILTVAGAMGPTYPMHTPFNANVIINGTALPNIYNGNNATTGLVSQVTTNVSNATNAGGTGAQLFAISNSFFYGLGILWAFIQFFTGGFAFGVLGMFGFSQIFIYGLQAIFGILLVRSIIYYFSGR